MQTLAIFIMGFGTGIFSYYIIGKSKKEDEFINPISFSKDYHLKSLEKNEKNCIVKKFEKSEIDDSF